jgi:UDP-N-acetylglucosamine 2-epimerase (non-hydrolysing)
MISFEKVVTRERPDLVIVVGDVNSTLACALVATKVGVTLAHIEAGLRSFDRTMPEEINRVVTDCISDYLFVSEESGLRDLMREGIASNKIHFVGNVMIDSLIWADTQVGNSKRTSIGGLPKLFNVLEGDADSRFAITGTVRRTGHAVASASVRGVHAAGRSTAGP